MKDKVYLENLTINADAIASNTQGILDFAYSNINAKETKIESINILIGFLTSLLALTEKHSNEVAKFEEENS